MALPLHHSTYKPYMTGHRHLPLRCVCLRTGPLVASEQSLQFALPLQQALLSSVTTCRTKALLLTTHDLDVQLKLEYGWRYAALLAQTGTTAVKVNRFADQAVKHSRFVVAQNVSTDATHGPAAYLLVFVPWS